MTTTITRPAPHAAYVRRGTCLGKRNPDCTAATHGTNAAYKRGCRCPHAQDDHRIYQKRRREGRAAPRLIDATGTQRRIQALWALGHTSATIGAAVDLTENNIQEIVRSRDFVTYSTWHAIDRAYRALSAVPGTSDRNRNRARRVGYASPLAWDDDAIDDPHAQPVDMTAEPDRPEGYDEITVALAVDGRLTYEQLNAHRPDLIEAVRRLAQRMTDVEIARHLRWPGADDGEAGKTRGQNSVGRIRHREGIAGPERFQAVYAYRPGGQRTRPRKTTQAA